MNINRDNLHRGAKILIDLDLAKTWDEAYAMIGRYRLGIVVGRDVTESASAQGCILTMINTGIRACPGGVFVYGLNGDEPLKTKLGNGNSLCMAIERLGGTVADCEPPRGIFLVCVGDVSLEERDLPAIRATFGGWSGGVAPISADLRLTEDCAFPPAAILAGSLAVSECFAHLIGSNNVAGKRALGLSLLKPGSNWRDGQSAGLYLPKSLWLLGLGHLGQAYAWTIGALPFPHGSRPELILQDYDEAKEANLSTSVLTTRCALGRRKTRFVAKWLDRRGFLTRLVERSFEGDISLRANEPRVLLSGVDNLPARRLLELPGFSLVVDAGLGAIAEDYDGFCVQTFTDKGRAKVAFPESERSHGPDEAAKRNSIAYEGLGLDKCGMHLAADAAVGVPFVGVAVSTLVIAETCRAIAGQGLLDTTVGNLGDIEQIETASAGTRITNPGYIGAD